MEQVIFGFWVLMGLLVAIAALSRVFRIWKLMRKLKRSKKYASAKDQFLAYCEECNNECKKNLMPVWDDESHYKKEERLVVHRSNNYQSHKIHIDKRILKTRSRGLVKRKYYFLVVWEFVWSNDTSKKPYTKLISQKKIMYYETILKH